jgi:hypothetical protein
MFHSLLQVAMGRTNSHLHHFLTAKARYSDPRHNEDMGLGEEPDHDEAKALLVQVVPDKGAQFGYRVAQTQNVAQVALEAGNSPRVVFSNCRELVRPADAAKWFAIAPDAEEKVIPMSVVAGAFF